MNVNFRHLIPTSATIVLLSSAAVASHAQGNSINVTLSSETANLNGSDDVTVNVTMTNVGAAPVSVPKWYVPSQSTTSGVFTVTRNGEPVAYLGALVKRKPFGPRDFVRIAAGASLDFKVELSALYDLSTTGVYNIQYDVKSVQTLRTRALDSATADQQASQSQTDTQDLLSNSIALTITGDANVESRRATEAAAVERASEAVAPAFAASVSFIGCSNTRSTQIRTALTSAESYASNSVSYLNAGTRGPRYTTWFGTYNSNRYSTVRSHFANISNAASTKPLAFDCSTCPGTDYADAYAYVYSNQPYRIYLCNSFWAAPNAGTDSRAGTIIHELSHFSVVAGTNDYAYGKTAARNLARTNPSRAVRNADNHEYFGENTPAQN
jgi:peptidyl-Lys metalloendopeptidase